jgi:hypothetical protein
MGGCLNEIGLPPYPTIFRPFRAKKFVNLSILFLRVFGLFLHVVGNEGGTAPHIEGAIEDGGMGEVLNFSIYCKNEKSRCPKL